MSSHWRELTLGNPGGKTVVECYLVRRRKDTLLAFWPMFCCDVVTRQAGVAVVVGTTLSMISACPRSQDTHCPFSKRSLPKLAELAKIDQVWCKLA